MNPINFSRKIKETAVWKTVQVESKNYCLSGPLWVPHIKLLVYYTCIPYKKEEVQGDENIG